jgi:hypothetical protein
MQRNDEQVPIPNPKVYKRTGYSRKDIQRYAKNQEKARRKMRFAKNDE